MAKKNLKHSGQFKKGNQAAKGHGRPELPPDVKRARELNSNEFTRLATKYLYMNDIELEAAEISEEVPQIEKLVISMIIKAHHGDHNCVKLLLERTIGPPPEAPKTVNHNFNFSHLPAETVIDIGKEAIRFLEETPEDRER